MENDDPTTWYKECGMIAQESYYDAPESMHLVHRGKPDLDEEGNCIPLPEIPIPIDPQQDPDYSSWGKDPASVNYIGLIAYGQFPEQGFPKIRSQGLDSGEKIALIVVNYVF